MTAAVDAIINEQEEDYEEERLETIDWATEEVSLDFTNH